MSRRHLGSTSLLNDPLASFERSPCHLCSKRCSYTPEDDSCRLRYPCTSWCSFRIISFGVKEVQYKNVRPLGLYIAAKEGFDTKTDSSSHVECSEEDAVAQSKSSVIPRLLGARHIRISPNIPSPPRPP